MLTKNESKIKCLHFDQNVSPFKRGFKLESGKMKINWFENLEDRTAAIFNQSDSCIH